MTIAHNTITNTLGDAIVFGDALEGVIEDNVLTNAGGGILISAFGPYGGPAAYGPVMNTDVLRNILTVGDGNFIFRDSGILYLWGIGIQDFPGCSASGLMIRDNTVTAVQTIYNTDGVNGISANVVEQNQAYGHRPSRPPGSSYRTIHLHPIDGCRTSFATYTRERSCARQYLLPIARNPIRKQTSGRPPIVAFAVRMLR